MGVAQSWSVDKCVSRTKVPNLIAPKLPLHLAQMVARRVEAADLGRDIGPEGAVARDEREERQHKQLLERQACLQRRGQVTV